MPKQLPSPVKFYTVVNTSLMPLSRVERLIKEWKPINKFGAEKILGKILATTTEPSNTMNDGTLMDFPQSYERGNQGLYSSDFQRRFFLAWSGWWRADLIKWGGDVATKLCRDFGWHHVRWWSKLRWVHSVGLPHPHLSKQWRLIVVQPPKEVIPC